METVLNSFILVAATEMGDKTQLLALVLALRFRNSKAVLSGIFVATILNHLLAAWVGNWVAQAIPSNYLRWILGLLFMGFALWVLIPDEDENQVNEKRSGAFVTTVTLFFLAEMGDKTQLSTIALAAKYGDVVLVTIGTTLGMMFSDGLAVLFGEKLIQKVPMKAVRIFSAVLFFIFGLSVLFFE